MVGASFRTLASRIIACLLSMASNVRKWPGDTVAMGNLSPDLTGPVQLELAKGAEQLPGPHGMPGGSRYELKRDGFLH